MKNITYLLFAISVSSVFAQSNPSALPPQVPATQSGSSPTTTKSEAIKPTLPPTPATNQVPAATPVAPAVKPESAPPPATTPPPVKPADNTQPSELKPASPPIPPIKKDEPELDPATKRLIEEAKQKILREKAEREALEKKAQQEEAERKKEAEKSIFLKLYENSGLYTGIAGGLGLSLNNIHSTGYGMGATVDYLAFKHYGLHLGVETGQFPTNTVKLQSGDTTLAISNGGTFGYLAFDFAALYAFPRIFQIEAAFGVGVTIYQLSGGNYDFGKIFSPKILISAYHEIFPHLQVGLILNGMLSSTSQMQVNGTSYSLDTSAGLSTMSIQLAVRYRWL